MGSPADSVVSPVLEPGSADGETTSSSTSRSGGRSCFGGCEAFGAAGAGAGADFGIGPAWDDLDFLDFEGIVQVPFRSRSRKLGASFTIWSLLRTGIRRTLTWMRKRRAAGNNRLGLFAVLGFSLRRVRGVHRPLKRQRRQSGTWQVRRRRWASGSWAVWLLAVGCRPLAVRLINLAGTEYFREVTSNWQVRCGADAVGSHSRRGCSCGCGCGGVPPPLD